MSLIFKWCVLLVLFHNTMLTLSSCDDDSLYLIRSTASSLVLDGNNGIVTIQYFDGYAQQLWKFKSGNRPGLFYIMNSSNRKVLDVEAPSMRVILAPEKDVLKQQWFIHQNGRIVNAEINRNLDVINAKYVPGNPIGVVVNNGNAAQEFSIKEKMTCCPTSCPNPTNSASTN